ncbi:nucleotide exchange factor GrpE [bacterium]|nr:nucleotide exchange factor GrpE [bacterium]
MTKKRNKSEEVQKEQLSQEDLINKIKTLKKELEKCSQEREEYLNGWKRERADFLNYKKDEKKRMEKVQKMTQIEILNRIIEILDSFERAEKQISQDLTDNPIIRGFLGIKKQLEELLKNFNIKEINIKEGMDFDPRFCEAVEIVETDDTAKDHKIAQIITKGYLVGDVILRPFKVKVFKKVDK